MSRPFHNLSGNGRAATSQDTGMTNRGLGASRGSDERLRAGRARRSHLSHEVICELTWSCESLVVGLSRDDPRDTWGIGDVRYGPFGGSGGSRAGPGLKKKSDPSPFEDLPSVRLVPMGST